MRVYCVIYFPDLCQAVCLDRQYRFITEELRSVDPLHLNDIIDWSPEFFAGLNVPQWAVDAVRKGHRHLAMWFRDKT